MELRYIVSFLAIAEELHFGRAAARLHLAQPSLSQQLQRLEREVGAQLVARNSHTVALTAAGRAFRQEARQLIDQLDRAVSVAREAAAGHAGHVHIGFNYPAGHRVLPPTLSLLRREHPRILTTLREGRTSPQLAALRDRQLDVAFVYGAPDATRLRHTRVLTVPIVAVVADRHPLAARSGIPCAELADAHCILFNRAQSPAMYDALVDAARQCGVALTVTDRVDDPAATEIVVAAEEVVGFASAIRAANGLSSGLRAIPLIDPTPMLEINAVWRADDTSQAVDTFLDTLEAARPAFTEP